MNALGSWVELLDGSLYNERLEIRFPKTVECIFSCTEAI